MADYFFYLVKSALIPGIEVFTSGSILFRSKIFFSVCSLFFLIFSFHSCTILLSSSNIFLRIILNFLPDLSYTLISLVPVSAALFCPFDETLLYYPFLSFHVPFSFVLVSVHTKKYPYFLVFMYWLWQRRPSPVTPAGHNEGLWIYILWTCVCRFLIRRIC